MKKDQLKVEIVNRYFYPVTAGIETVLIETYSILAKKGWDITIHTSKNTLSEKNVLSDSAQINGLKIKRYPFNKLTFIPKPDWKKIDILTLYNFDVLPHLLLLLYILGFKISGKKNFKLFLVPASGFNPNWALFPILARTIKKLYHYTLGTVLINNVVDGVLAISKWEKSEMIKKGVSPKLIKIIGLGVEKEATINVDKVVSKASKLLVGKIGDYIIQVARIDPIKNFETVIKALPLLPEKLKFIIVGPVQNPAYRQELEDLIKKLHLSSRVFLLGAVSAKDKFYLIKHAKMMVHMSSHEGYCIAVLEGLSQGLVCIVANNTALPYLVKDKINGYSIETKDYKLLAEKINYVFDNLDSKEIKKIQQNNRQTFGKQTYGKISEELFKYYSNVIGNQL